jgi:mono/diheme cytochrome c family protein
MKKISLVLTFAITLTVAACTDTSTPTETSSTPASRPATAPEDEFAAARANFGQHCVACHGENATGGLVKINSKEIKVPSLKTDHALEHSDEELKNLIANGEQVMPPFKDKLSDAEIAELVTFVRKELQGK